MSTGTSDLNLEAAILGALILQGRIPHEIRAQLSVDFFSEDRKIQATAVLAANDDFGVCDLAAVREALLRQEASLDLIWDLSKCAEMVPSAAHLSAHVRVLRERNGAAFGPGPILVSLSDVQPESISWLWPGRIPIGKLTLVVGDPGVGKSYLLVDLAAKITRGARWPDGGMAPTGKAILLTAEDGIADTVRPRLDAMGGDPSSVMVLTGIRRKTANRVLEETPFTLDTDLRQLEAAILQTQALFVGIDPLSAYLGKTESWKDAQVRSLLAPLAALAERRNVAILGVMHLGKDSQRRALYRTQGSLAFVAAARSVFVVTADDENPSRRLFLPLKMNIAAPPPGLAFTITDCLIWDSEPVSKDVDEVLGSSHLPEERAERGDARDFLVEILADGPVLVQHVHRQARTHGISPRTLRRAKKDLQIESERGGGIAAKGIWYWALPKSAKACSKGSNISNVAPLDKVSATTDLLTHSLPNMAKIEIYKGTGHVSELPAPEIDPEWLAKEEDRFRRYWATLPDKTFARTTWPAEVRSFCTAKGLGQGAFTALTHRCRDLRLLTE